jgi:hypothetical protein
MEIKFYFLLKRILKNKINHEDSHAHNLVDELNGVMGIHLICELSAF